MLQYDKNHSDYLLTAMINKDWRLSLRAKINQLSKIRVGAVSYLNTKPLLFGIKKHPVSKEIVLIEDYPSKIAQMLVDDEIDIGLVPVATTLRLDEWYIHSNYCIGSVGPVASVCIFSDVPMEGIKSVYLDYQSKTSVNLAKILLKEYWKKDVEFVGATGEDFRQELKGTTAGVVIGDRALEQRKKSKYVYDLGEAWKEHTGLPFVFAAWIANKKLPENFTAAFNEANALGLQNIEHVIMENQFSSFDLKTYYTSCISYEFDDEKKKGLGLFLSKLEKLYNS